jgi:hypothetical protein
VIPYLLLNDFTVDLSSGDVVFPGEGDVKVSLVVSQIQIDLTTIVQYKDFTVPVTIQHLSASISIKCLLLGRRHSSSIDVHVWINLDGRDVHSKSVPLRRRWRKYTKWSCSQTPREVRYIEEGRGGAYLETNGFEQQTSGRGFCRKFESIFVLYGEITGV